MKNDIKHIESLLNLFMQGETTLEQERELSQFFSSTQDIPQEWMPYREMMAYFDDGMPLEKANNHRWNIARPVWLVVAAAVAALVIMVVSNLFNSPRNKLQEAEPVIAKDDTTKPHDAIVPVLSGSKPVMTKAEKEKPNGVQLEPQKSKKHKCTMLHNRQLDAVEIEREKGEMEQAQQELMADQFIIEQERQEILDEQYAGRAQAFQAQQAIINENPQYIQVVFK